MQRINWIFQNLMILIYSFLVLLHFLILATALKGAVNQMESCVEWTKAPGTIAKDADT